MMPPRAPDFTHGSVLLSLWFLVVLVAVTVAFAMVSVGVCRPGPRARLRLTARSARIVAAGSMLLAVLCGGLTVADGVNRHYAYMPSFSALRGNYSRDLVGHQQLLKLERESAAGRSPAHGIVERVWLSGARSGIARHGFVYLPRAYFDRTQPERRFPVLYMLHGSPGVASDWLRAGFVDRAMDDLIDRNKLDPYIVVLPDVNGGYSRDTECQDIVGGAQVQTYLAYDVTASVDSHYRTIASSAGRVIGGLSTGGYCALNLMLRHQDVFSAAVMHSGSLSPIESRYSGQLWAGSLTLRRREHASRLHPESSTDARGRRVLRRRCRRPRQRAHLHPGRPTSGRTPHPRRDARASTRRPHLLGMAKEPVPITALGIPVVQPPVGHRRLTTWSRLISGRSDPSSTVGTVSRSMSRAVLDCSTRNGPGSGLTDAFGVVARCDQERGDGVDASTRMVGLHTYRRRCS